MLYSWTQHQGLRASFISLPFSIHWKTLQAKIIWKKLPLCITLWAVKNVPHETRGSRSNNFFFWRARCNKSGKRSPHDNKKGKEISGKSEDSSLLQYKASLICTWESVFGFEILERYVLFLAFLPAWVIKFTIHIHYTVEEGGNQVHWGWNQLLFQKHLHLLIQNDKVVPWYSQQSWCSRGLNIQILNKEAREMAWSISVCHTVWRPQIRAPKPSCLFVLFFF